MKDILKINIEEDLIIFLEKNIKIQNISKEIFHSANIPYIQPLTDEQYNFTKNIWPISNSPTVHSKLLYVHSKEEESEIFNLFKNLLNLKKKCNVDSILYDPKNKIIVNNSEIDDSFNPIGHSIMKLIDNYVSGSSDQYYCENLFILTIKEPCFMCSMALVHSRIERLYFMERNMKDGCSVSKLKINNYNLNHSYLIYEINLD